MLRGTGRSAAGRVVRLILGWALTVAGIILGPVPVVPGFVFLLPGLAILCAESRWIRRILRRVREHWLLRRAMREAERAGLSLDPDPDEDDERRRGPS